MRSRKLSSLFDARRLLTAAVALSAVCMISAPAWAQQRNPRQFIDPSIIERLRAREVPPLAEGQTRLLEAVIIDVKGRAQWRNSDADAWQAAQVDDVLRAGASLRTGTESRITLRVGHNATVFIADRTRLSLPEIVQDGSTLRTRAVLRDGDADIKVERVGLTNDFEVITPTTTLAVKGTGFRIIAGALEGVQVRASRENMIRAIELSYIFKKMRVYLSGNAKSSEVVPNPVLNAMHDTLGPPAVWGAAVDAYGALEGGFARDINFEGERQLQLGGELDDRFEDFLGTFPPDGNGEPLDLFEFFGGFGNSLELAMFICMIEPQLFSAFEQELRGAGIFESSRFFDMHRNIIDICQALEEYEDPLLAIILEVVTYCDGLTGEENQNRCYEAFGHSFEVVFR